MAWAGVVGMRIVAASFNFCSQVAIQLHHLWWWPGYFHPLSLDGGRGAAGDWCACDAYHKCHRDEDDGGDGGGDGKELYGDRLVIEGNNEQIEWFGLEFGGMCGDLEVWEFWKVALYRAGRAYCQSSDVVKVSRFTCLLMCSRT